MEKAISYYYLLSLLISYCSFLGGGAFLLNPVDGVQDMHPLEVRTLFPDGSTAGGFGAVGNLERPKRKKNLEKLEKPRKN